MQENKSEDNIIDCEKPKQTIEISVAKAIQIARLLAYCPPERLPMVLDVLGKAGIDIDGVEEYVELNIKGRIAELDKIAEQLTELGQEYNGEIIVLPEVFNRFCSKHKLKPRIVRQQLYYEGYIKAFKEKNRLVYSSSLYVDGDTKRYIVFFNNVD